MLQCHTCIFKTRYHATCKNAAFRVLGLKNNEEKNNKSDITELELKLQMFKGRSKRIFTHTYPHKLMRKILSGHLQPPG